MSVARFRSVADAGDWSPRRPLASDNLKAVASTSTAIRRLAG